MKLVTNHKEAEKLPVNRWDQASLVDLVLDDGSYVPGACIVDEAAFGVVIGGQTGAIEFHEIPEARDRQVVAHLAHTTITRVPLLGTILRSLWARRNGSRRKRPPWLPTF